MTVASSSVCGDLSHRLDDVYQSQLDRRPAGRRTRPPLGNSISTGDAVTETGRKTSAPANPLANDKMSSPQSYSTRGHSVLESLKPVIEGSSGRFPRAAQ